MNKTLKTFLAISVCSSCLFFVLNKNHDVQQGIYQNYYVPLAKSLSQGDGYVLDRPNAESAYFPMWGYSLVLAIPLVLGISPDVFILSVQWVLCLLGVFLFYMIFDRRPKIWHILFLIPWLALMSVKWPEALNGILVLLILFYVKRLDATGQRRYMVYAAIASGIGLQFRTEMLLWPVALVILAVMMKMVKTRTIVRLDSIVLFLLVVLLALLPWAIRSYANTGKVVLVSSNSGAVFYIGLGQLPNNPWGITYDDSSAIAFAGSRGESDPWSPRANEIFLSEDLRLVETFPFQFLLKCGYTGGRALIGGCFTGEMPTLMETSARLNLVRSRLAKGDLDFFLHNLSVTEKLLWIIQIAFILCFRIVVLILFALFVRSLMRMKIPRCGWLDIFVIGLVLSKLLTIMLVQYESRHINLIYLPLIGWSIFRAQSGDQWQASQV